MAGGLRQHGENIFITILFVVFLLMFTIQFLGVQNPNSEAIKNDKYGLITANNTLIAKLNNFTTTTKSFQEDLSNAKPSPIQFVFLIFEGGFYIPLAFLNFIGSGITTLFAIIYQFGGGGWGGVLAITTSVIIAVLMIRLILYIIKTIRTGDSER